MESKVNTWKNGRFITGFMIQQLICVCIVKVSLLYGNPLDKQPAEEEKMKKLLTPQHDRTS